MSKVAVKNEGPSTVTVVLYRCREDGWGKEHRDLVKRIQLATGEECSLDVSGDVRGGGGTIEAYESIR